MRESFPSIANVFYRSSKQSFGLSPLCVAPHFANATWGKPCVLWFKITVFLFLFLGVVPLVDAQVICSTDTSYTYYVRATGSDANTGRSYATAFRTIQRAADTLTAGQKVCVASGTYRERITVKSSGTSDTNRVLFQGEPGALVDGGDIFTGWVQDVGTGCQTCDARVWKKQLGYAQTNTPHSASLDNHYVERIGDSQISSGSWKSILLQGPDVTNAGIACCGGAHARRTSVLTASYAPVSVSGSTWTFVRIFPTAGAGYDGADPGVKAMTFAPKDYGTFDIYGKSYVTISGFTIRNGFSNINVTGNSDHIIVENNTLRTGVKSARVQAGANNNIVRNNQITLDYFTRMDTNTDWGFWDVVKLNGDFEPIGIDTENAGANNQFYGNHLFDVFDGADLGYGSPGDDGIKFYNNFIDHAADDGIVIGNSTGTNAEVFDNRIINSNIGIRIWNGNSGSYSIYRNTYYGPDTGISESLGLYLPNAVGTTNFRTQRIYHNSFSCRNGITFGNAGGGWTSTYIANNAFSNANLLGINDWTGWVALNSSNRPRFDYNWVSSGVDTNWMGAHNVSGGGMRIWPANAEPTGWALPSASSARNIGIDLSVAQSLFPATPWPGLSASPKYFSGSNPEAGGVQGMTLAPTAPSGLRIVQ